MKNSKSSKPVDPALANRVDEVMCAFDFQKVHMLMMFMGWGWCGGVGIGGVPSVTEMETVAREMLTCVAVNKAKRCAQSTGGFWAYKSDGVLSLLFVPVEAAVNQGDDDGGADRA